MPDEKTQTISQTNSDKTELEQCHTSTTKSSTSSSFTPIDNWDELQFLFGLTNGSTSNTVNSQDSPPKNNNTGSSSNPSQNPQNSPQTPNSSTSNPVTSQDSSPKNNNTGSSSNPSQNPQNSLQTPNSSTSNPVTSQDSPPKNNNSGSSSNPSQNPPNSPQTPNPSTSNPGNIPNDSTTSQLLKDAKAASDSAQQAQQNAKTAEKDAQAARDKAKSAESEAEAAKNKIEHTLKELQELLKTIKETRNIDVNQPQIFTQNQPIDVNQPSPKTQKKLVVLIEKLVGTKNDSWNFFKRHKFKFLLGVGAIIALIPLLFLLSRLIKDSPPNSPKPTPTPTTSTPTPTTSTPIPTTSTQPKILIDSQDTPVKRSIYVNPIYGDDSNNGTEVAPFRSLSGAIQNIQKADKGSITTIYLAQGEHLVSQTLTIPENTTVVNQSFSDFNDIKENWAAPFIRALATKGLIAGYPDGSFKPDGKLTRAEYATLLTKAFNLEKTGSTKNFVDIPKNFWAYEYIQTAYRRKFLIGYPGDKFQPQESIQKSQVIVSLVSGLGNLSPAPLAKLDYYQDKANIPNWAKNQIATATTYQLIANYPQLQQLRPTLPATRAEASVMMYQALVQTYTMPKIDSPYLVKP